MAETSVKITLELADKAAQQALSNFVAKSSAADKSLKTLQHTSEGTFSEIAIHMGKATGAYDIFVGNIAANLAVKAFDLLAEGASRLFDVFIVEGVHAAIEAEDALNSLNVALKASGIFSKETSEDFVKFAAQIQKTTAFSDDAVLKNAALIQSLAQLDEKGLKRATLAAVNMSAALGKDLASASEVLAKAASGNVVALQKMGIEIQKGQNDAETFANALAALEARFDGAAAAKVLTYSGAIAQAGNAFNDLQEAVGDVIIKNPALIAIIQEASKIFDELTGRVRENTSALSALVTKGIREFLGASAFVVEEIDLTVRLFQTLYGVIASFSVILLPFTVLIRSLAVGFEQANEEASAFAESARKNLVALGTEGRGALFEVSSGIRRLQDATNKPLKNDLLDSITNLVDPTKRVSLLIQGDFYNSVTGMNEKLGQSRGKVSELTEEMKRSQEALKSFAGDLVKQSTDAKSAADAELEVAKAKSEAEIALNQSLLDQKLISQVEFLAAKALAEDEYNAARQDIDIQRLADEQARLAEARSLNLITEREYDVARTQLANNFTVTQIKADADIYKNNVKTKKELLEAERTLNRQKVQAVSDTLGALSSLMQTNSKELFEVGKAAAIAEATINTYLAVTKTMASIPYPFNIPLAIAQGIAGFVQVSKIASTNPSFEQGGIVPGTSFTGDNVTANVNSGEMILNRAQQANLFQMANNGGGDSSRVESLLSQLLVAIKDQAIVVNVGGKAIVDSLRSELASGRTF